MTTKTDITLQPCPFCGGEAEMDAHQYYLNITTGHPGDRIAIYCTECGADMGICREDVPDITPEQVAEMWNRRAAVEADRQGNNTMLAHEWIRPALNLPDDAPYPFLPDGWIIHHDPKHGYMAQNRSRMGQGDWLPTRQAATACAWAMFSAQPSAQDLANAEHRGYARGEAENVGYRTDAERYRAMRAAALSDDRDFLDAADQFLAHLADRETPNIAEFDAAIDAARAAKGADHD